MAAMTQTSPQPSRESDRIETELRQMILSMELAPGLSVSEAWLQKKFGWGRTPMREAFQRLAEQSLLQITPRHGVVIAGLNIFAFTELMDAMSMVIGPSAALACRRISDQELLDLEENVRQAGLADEKRDFTAVSSLDYQFHRILADCTGNRYLSRYLDHLHTIAIRFNFTAWKRDGSAKISLSEHCRIIESLRKRDPMQAKGVMLEHIENARQRILGNIVSFETDS
jgi:DNA-binding GntR family transcriptional regulator